MKYTFLFDRNRLNIGRRIYMGDIWNKYHHSSHNQVPAGSAVCHHFCETNLSHLFWSQEAVTFTQRQKIWISIPNKYDVAPKQICFQPTRNISHKYLVFINSLKTGPHSVEWIQWWNQTLVMLFTFGQQEYKGSQSTICVLQILLKLFKIKNGIWERTGSQEPFSIRSNK